MYDTQTVEIEIRNELDGVDAAIAHFEDRRDHGDERGMGEAAETLRNQMDRFSATLGGYMSEGVISHSLSRELHDQFRGRRERALALLAPVSKTQALALS